MSRLRDQDKGGIPGLLTIKEDDSRWKKKKVNVRRGTRGIHEHEIDEDDEEGTDAENTGQNIDSQDFSGTDHVDGYMKCNARGIELSRISGDITFTDDEHDQHLEQDPEAKKLAERLKFENVQAWIKDQSDRINQRNFNENDIIGNFERDWRGKIIDRDNVLRKCNFKDQDG